MSVSYAKFGMNLTAEVCGISDKLAIDPCSVFISDLAATGRQLKTLTTRSLLT